MPRHIDTKLGTKWPVGMYLFATASYLNGIDAVAATATMTTTVHDMYPERTPLFHINTTQRPVGAEAIKAATACPHIPRPPPNGNRHPYYWSYAPQLHRFRSFSLLHDNKTM